MNEEVILRVDLQAEDVDRRLGQVVKTIEGMKDRRQELTKAIKDGKDADGEMAKELLAINDALAWQQKQAKSLSKEYELLITSTDQYGDSLNEERRKLADMHKAYDGLSAAMRDSSAGQEFLRTLQAQDEKVKQLEQSTGRMQRNVGNYPSAMSALIPEFDKVNGMLGKIGLSIDGLAQSGTKGFSTLGGAVKSFGKAFITPPIVIIAGVLSAIMFAVNKVSEAFKKNDEATTTLERAFAQFAPIGEAVRAVFDSLAVVLGKVALGVANAVTWVAKLSPAYREAAKGADGLVVAQDKLEDSERAYAENSSKRNLQIARLRNEVAQSKDLNVRKKKLTEAINLEKQNLAEDKRIKAEQLRILEERARRERDTSDETKNKIIAARKAMLDAEQNYFNGTRRLQQQLTNINTAILTDEEKAAQEDAKRKAEERKREAQERAREAAERAKEAKREAAERAKEAKREAAERAKEQARQAAERIKNEADIRKMVEDAQVASIKDERERQEAQLRLTAEREIAALRERLARKGELTEEAEKNLNMLIEMKQTELQVKLTEIQTKATLDDAKKQTELRIALAEAGSQEELEAKKANLLAQMAIELNNTELTEEEKLAIKKRYADQADALDKERGEKRVSLLREFSVIAPSKQYDEARAKLQDALDKQLISEQEYAEAVKVLDQQTALTKAQNVMNYAQQVNDILGSIFDAVAKNEEAELNRYKADNETKKTELQDRLDSGLVSQEDYDSAIAEIEAEQEQREKEIQLKQAKRQKAISVMQATMAAATAIIQSLAQSPISYGPFPNPAGIASLALATATGIAQVAQAAATPLPKFADGGVVRGAYDRQDSVLARVSGGETILNPQQAGNVLYQLANNNASVGANYDAMASAMAAAVSAQPAPVMVYSEYNQFKQNVAQYNELASL